MSDKPDAATETDRPVGRPWARIVLVILLIFGLSGGGLAIWAWQAFNEGDGATATKTIIIPKGTGLSAMAAMLEEQDLVSDARLFSLGVVVHDAQSDLKAGEYIIDRGMPMAAIMHKLQRGETVARRLSVPEGLSVKQVLALLEAEDALTGEIESAPSEGSLLPETYHFSLSDSRNAIITRMQEAMDEALAERWATRDESLPLQSPQEVLILASIVEKETGVDNERAHIAGVFVNRLNLGMPLQSDPTIVYGITKGLPLGRGIRQSELKQKTDYNTYHFKGLPPTPIANPGIASIEAVLNPLETKDLYFVADGTGGHVFAETYKDHQRNVRAWRRLNR